MLPEISNKIKPVITVYYGPYEANGIIKHKVEKLHGLIACLKNLDYEVELIPVASLNMITIEILGFKIQRGGVQFLKFNMECEDDSVCRNIVCKVKEALHRMYKPYNPGSAPAETDIEESIMYKDNSGIKLQLPKLDANYILNFFS